MKFHRAKQVLACIIAFASMPYSETRRQNSAPIACDFDESMGFARESHKDVRLKKEKMPLMKFCKDLYCKNNLAKIPVQKDPIIPKKVHLIWLGPKTPPPVFGACVASIKEFLPDWEYKLWTDQDVPGLHLHNQKYYDEETNYAAKADILRYELLYRFGGLYLDVDMVLLKSLNVLNHTYEFYTGLQPSCAYEVFAIGLIASIAGHPILKHCIEEIKSHRNRRGIPSRTGPAHFEQSFYEVVKTISSERVIAFPASFFYPVEPDQKDNVELHQYIKPESFTVHHWAASWWPKKR